VVALKLFFCGAVEAKLSLAWCLQQLWAVNVQTFVCMQMRHETLMSE